MPSLISGRGGGGMILRMILFFVFLKGDISLFLKFFETV